MKKIIFMILVGSMLAVTSCTNAPRSVSDPKLPAKSSQVAEMPPTEAETRVSMPGAQFVDVRTPAEYAGGHAARAVNIPLDTLPSSLDRLKKDQPVYVICQTGRRSKMAAALLSDSGFTDVVDIPGGTTAWSEAGLPMEKPTSDLPFAR